MKTALKAWSIGIKPWIALTLMINVTSGVHLQLALRLFTEEISFGLSHWHPTIMDRPK